MMLIFVDMIEMGLNVLMDDFSVSRDSFIECLGNLERVYERFEEKN